MSRRLKGVLLAVLAAAAVTACGAGGGNVYVGVGVVGPYWGHPGGYGYPGYVGRPPIYYWDDDDDQDADDVAATLEAERQSSGAAGEGEDIE